MNIHRGISMRDAIAAAQRLGLVTERVGTTGEVRVYDPRRPRGHGTGVVVNSRRKDTPRHLVVLLRRTLSQVDSAAGGAR